MYARKPNPSRLWLAASAVAVLAATATPVAALESITRPERAAVVMLAASVPLAACMTADATGGAASPCLAEPTATTLGESQDQSDFTVIRNGISHRYTVHDGETFRILDDGTRRPVTASERREVARHRRAAAQAARHIRSQEAHIRRQEAHVRAQEAHVREQMAHVRTQLTLAADQFSNGARQLREEADRRRDPAHRAREIEKARSQGEAVTEQQLIDSISQLRQSADEMEREATRILASAPQ